MKGSIPSGKKLMASSRNKNPKFKRTIGVVIVNNSDKVLLQLRDNKAGIHLPGIWALFGGGINKNESTEEAAYREIKEETGLSLDNLTYLKRVIFEDRDSSIFYSLVNLESADGLNISEGCSAKFFSMDEVNELFRQGKTHQIILDILGDFFSKYKKNG